jgi:phosphate starvation-inducible PhoH-like protein
MRVLRNVEDISQCMLTQRDVVRHVLVQRIIDAYEKSDIEKKTKKKK